MHVHSRPYTWRYQHGLRHSAGVAAAAVVVVSKRSNLRYFATRKHWNTHIVSFEAPAWAQPYCARTSKSLFRCMLGEIADMADLVVCRLCLGRCVMHAG